MSYFWSYLLPTCSLILAIIIFLVGRQSYILHPPLGSVLATTLSIVKEAIRKSWRPALSSLFLDHWLDRAKQRYGGTYSNWEVEDVKKVYRLLPIFGTFILYWTVYAQVSVRDIVLPSRKPSCHPPFPSYPILSSLSLPLPCMHPFFPILSPPFPSSYPVILSPLRPPFLYHPIPPHPLHSPYNPSLLSLAPSKSPSLLLTKYLLPR